MFYQHEQEERKPNTSPMNRDWPKQDLATLKSLDYLEKRNLSVRVAIENGWYVSYEIDGFERIVIPAVTHKEGHVYWQARDTSGMAWLRYQSPKGPRHEAFIVVRPTQMVKKGVNVVVVEGPMDALAAAGEGYVGIALMGMVPSKETVQYVAKWILARALGNTLVVMDKGEVANSTRIATLLAAYGVNARVAELSKKDLAECRPLERQKFLNQKFSSLFKQRSSQKQVQHEMHA